MIWLDIIDPKYVLFFHALLPHLRKLDEVFITTRASADYSECAQLLELFNMPHLCVGAYGGQSKAGKLRARLERMLAFDEIFSESKTSQSANFSEFKSESKFSIFQNPNSQIFATQTPTAHNLASFQNPRIFHNLNAHSAQSCELSESATISEFRTLSESANFSESKNALSQSCELSGSKFSTFQNPQIFHNPNAHSAQNYENPNCQNPNSENLPNYKNPPTFQNPNQNPKTHFQNPNSQNPPNKNFAKIPHKRPKILITGASADAVQYAYGAGIPIVQFSDTPIIGHKIKRKDLSKLARLTLPLSDLIFCPFVLRKKCFEILGIERKNIKIYDFIDVALWLDSESFANTQAPKKDFLKALNLDSQKPIILAREEEFKAHYVKEKFSLFYESVRLLARNLNAQIVIFPRYEIEPLISEFSDLPNVKIARQKFAPSDFYPHIDLLLGGGGTMNLESCYLGIPTISTRSLLLFHDKYLIKNNLMQHCKSADEVLQIARQILKNHRAKTRQDKLFFKQDKNAALEKITRQIKARFY